ncbi:MAG: hypothetical protein JNL58_06515 [Planctomyces sp.]|nr:hypothetical protein [Planctomyces sp.]
MSILILIFVLLITGITSVVSHPLTLLGSAATAISFTFLGILNPSCRIKPLYFASSVLLCILCLLSFERNVATTSSTMHILACYSSLAGLSVAVPQFSDFCRKVCVIVFGVLSCWILAQTIRAGTVASWTVSGTAAAGNLMAAQLNMILPMILIMAFDTFGTRRNMLLVFAGVGMAAIVCVGSRNGIGSLLITLTLITLFKHIRSAILICSTMMGTIMMSEELMQLPFIASVLHRFRFVGYRSEAPRSLIWSVCSEYIFARPWLGIGPGRTASVLAVMDINHAHNNFVQVAIECGIPAALIAAFVFGSLLQLPASGLLHSRRAFVLSLSVIAYLAHSMTDIPMHHPQQTLLLILCVNEARRALLEVPETAQSTAMYRTSAFGSDVDRISGRRETPASQPAGFQMKAR